MGKSWGKVSSQFFKLHPLLFILILLIKFEGLDGVSIIRKINGNYFQSGSERSWEYSSVSSTWSRGRLL